MRNGERAIMQEQISAQRLIVLLPVFEASRTSRIARMMKEMQKIMKMKTA